jgi:hypothetical protein
MTKNNETPPPAADDAGQTAMNKRWYWIRAALVTILTFALVMVLAYPTRGNVAILWAAGLAAAILGYFVFSYYMLNR